MKEKDLSNQVVLNAGKRQRRMILITVCIALMAVIASVSGLNVAQPKLAIDFNASQSSILWMINIYTISLAALLLPLGALGDRIGRKPVLLVGLFIFGIASMMSGWAVSSTMMIVSRFLCGIGAAMIMPVTLSVITSTFPDEERSKAIGIWTGVAGGGGILGMYLSAVLVDLYTWRLLFVFPVILALIAIALTVRYIPNSAERTEYRFDTVGTLLSIIAIVGVVYTLHEAPVKGLSEPIVIGSLITGLISAVLFVVWELRQKAPLLDVSLFMKRGLSSGSVSLLMIFGVQAGIFIVLFPYFQGVLGWSGLRSTLAMMPMALLMMFSSGLAPKIAAQIGRRFTMASGILLGSLGAALMAILVSADGGYLSVLPGMLAMGIGMGLSMTPSTEAITSALPADRQGVASALNDITRELGTALGVALLGSLVSAGYRNKMDEKLDDIPFSIASSAREGISNAIAIAPKAGHQSDTLLYIARESFIYGWKQAMWAGVTAMLILFVYVLIYGPKKNKEKHVLN
ncbi:MFS transporter [Chryseobacterium sp. T16E-39]|uniref:MFS transporter n=1 Tax=Chryseobacterium sp. T16E-39 TaxID=2015076 RepID=UPI000B5B2A21|nr:MFS transporter [Chryseobacterium sp. T16E-39]ASK29249.1 MFS transporter [Chryseobacterium sp. T16E-39]